MNRIAFFQTLLKINGYKSKFWNFKGKNKKIQNFKNSNYNLILLITCGTIKKKKKLYFY